MAEPDLMRMLQSLPGVLTLSEFSSGLFIRGGTPDQNLILLDGTEVYNVNHLFGIFSTFDVDAVKQVDLIKGGFPAQYGGRMSSVLDITNMDGNQLRYEQYAPQFTVTEAGENDSVSGYAVPNTTVLFTLKDSVGAIKGTATKTCRLYVDPESHYGTGTDSSGDADETADGSYQTVTAAQYTVNTAADDTMGIPVVVRFTGASETWYIDTLSVTVS